MLLSPARTFSSPVKSSSPSAVSMHALLCCPQSVVPDSHVANVLSDAEWFLQLLTVCCWLTQKKGHFIHKTRSGKQGNIKPQGLLGQRKRIARCQERLCN